MKIEEAIKIFEDWAKCNYEPTKQAAQLALTALHSMPEAGEPLSLEQFKQMDGKPVWCEDVERWAIVSVSDAGKWKDVPFVLFEKNGGRFEWNVEDRELSLYSYPPAHIDRSKWEACDHCKKACWNCNHNLFAVKEMTKCDDCVNQSKWEFLAYQNYCPKCGRPLTEEAWAELERRLRG